MYNFRHLLYNIIFLQLRLQKGALMSQGCYRQGNLEVQLEEKTRHSAGIKIYSVKQIPE